jgi:hypothetical protein
MAVDNSQLGPATFEEQEQISLSNGNSPFLLYIVKKSVVQTFGEIILNKKE